MHLVWYIIKHWKCKTREKKLISQLLRCVQITCHIELNIGPYGDTSAAWPLACQPRWGPNAGHVDGCPLSYRSANYHRPQCRKEKKRISKRKMGPKSRMFIGPISNQQFYNQLRQASLYITKTTSEPSLIREHKALTSIWQGAPGPCSSATHGRRVSGPVASYRIGRSPLKN